MSIYKISLMLYMKQFGWFLSIPPSNDVLTQPASDFCAGGVFLIF